MLNVKAVTGYAILLEYKLDCNYLSMISVNILCL